MNILDEDSHLSDKASGNFKILENLQVQNRNELKRFFIYKKPCTSASKNQFLKTEKHFELFFLVIWSKKFS